MKLMTPPESCVTPPARDRLLEIADDGKAERGQPCRHVVDQREQILRKPHHPLMGRDVAGANLVGPVAPCELGHAIEHGPRRAEADCRQRDEPEEDAEDVPVRRKQRMLDDVTQQFGARQLPFPLQRFK